MLFDLDGVLVDSTESVERHWTAWAQEHGLDVKKVRSMIHGRRTVEAVRAVAPHLDAETEASKLDARQATDTTDIVPLPGAAQVLERLALQRWAVVTSGSRELASSRLRSAGLPLPAVFVCAEDVSQGKPAPEGYLIAARTLEKAPGDCVVIEDAVAGIQAANSAGMRVIALTTTHLENELFGAHAYARSLTDVHLGTGEDSEASADARIALETPKSQSL